MDQALNAALLPLFIVLFWLLIIYPAKWVLNKLMPDGQLKNALNKQRSIWSIFTRR